MERESLEGSLEEVLGGLRKGARIGGVLGLE